jgi:hypothetical protein
MILDSYIVLSVIFAFCRKPHVGFVFPSVNNILFAVSGWKSFAAVIALFYTFCVDTELLAS